MVNGVDIYELMAQAFEAYGNKKFEQYGILIGEASQKVLYGMEHYKENAPVDKTKVSQKDHKETAQYFQ